MLAMKRALVSVSDKTGLVEFIKELTKFNFEIISTGGTFKTLEAAGIPALKISEITGFPEILDGRVKTLHPAIYAGILARRELPEHVQTLKKLKITPIDFVIVNLYPFEATIARPKVSLEEALENIDIGGPTLIRAAAKNYSSVAVIVNPQRYPEIIAEVKKNHGELSLKTRQKLAEEAFGHTSDYDRVITSYLENLTTGPEKLPQVIKLALNKELSLRYGENPHQKAAFYTFTKKFPWEKLQGKELSFNNLLDLEAARSLVLEFENPAAAIIKHTNPSGVAESADIYQSYQKALAPDPVSAFGGIVALNRSVDEKLAKKLSEIFLEVIVAPEFSDEAIKILSAKQNLRIIRWPNRLSETGSAGAIENLDFKKITGGFLVQQKETKTETEKDFKNVTTKKPSPEQIEDLIFALKVVKHTKSNAIVVAKNQVTLGIGVGQTSRVKAVEQALKQAGKNAAAAVLASDAFFPFPDSVELAATAGIAAIIQPGGSVKDNEVIEAANKLDIAMVFTGIRHFRH